MDLYDKIQKFMIIAHRGASYDAPENTLAAFRLGIEQNSDAIECDIHLSADNEVVVIHDDTTKRTAGLDSRVSRLTVSEMKQLDAGRWKGVQFKNEKIPTLKEVFAVLPRHKKIFIEIKCGLQVIRPLKILLEESMLSHSQTIMMAFDLDTVVKLRETFPDDEILWLYEFPKGKGSGEIRESLNDIIYNAVKYHIDGVNIENIKEMDVDFIQACKGNNLRCYCWTVNNVARARYLVKNGIDGITTDRPGWMRAQLSSNIKIEQQ